MKRKKYTKEEHEKWLKSMKIGKRKRSSINSIPSYKVVTNAALSNTIPSSGCAPKRNTYTGTYVKGVATTHKSNSVPVTSREQAIDISKMRRN